jgi:hypothetical protein
MVIIGFDGTPISEHAVHEAAALLAPRKALVVVVWEAGRAFELADIPSPVVGMPGARSISAPRRRSTTRCTSRHKKWRSGAR